MSAALLSAQLFSCVATLPLHWQRCRYVQVVYTQRKLIKKNRNSNKNHEILSKQLLMHTNHLSPLAPSTKPHTIQSAGVAPAHTPTPNANKMVSLKAEEKKNAAKKKKTERLSLYTQYTNVPEY